jgi:hypothetical protein
MQAAHAKRLTLRGDEQGPQGVRLGTSPVAPRRLGRSGGVNLCARVLGNRLQEK